MLQQGEKAPDFSGINQNGKAVNLSDFKGKRIILYFYPKDNTPGCTAEACSLNDKNNFFLSKGFVVIGVSADSVGSHKTFGEKYNLEFSIISDPERQIIDLYGVWGEKKNYGKTYMGLIRTTFAISADGIIEKVFPKVDTKNHAEQIIKALCIDFS
ncbi:MAG: thioredoxin-dependent thiol peroxidase [Prevotellaceae bacterium]|jgi:peroxiredoxin Q/BCP|nr:thioredoxin-dependent thiol peroxidase [Prevotellaceae bacterium]